jgi:NADPH:quinone reductase-like Zn-dependent oxidoreductase
MQTIYFEQSGNPLEVLRTGEFPLPEPGENEVRIKVLASPVNPADLLFITGRYRLQPVFPQIAGLEGTGIVDKAGSGVTIKKGTAVSFWAQNVWSEYVVVNENNLYQLPPELPLHKAAQFALNPITAWALLHEARLQEDDWILLTAGYSSVARLVMQFAFKRNIRVIASVKKAAYAQGLSNRFGGLVHPVMADELYERVMELTGGKGVAATLDAAGGAEGAAAIQCTGIDGRILIYGLLNPEKNSFHNAEVMQRLLTVKGFALGRWLSAITAATKLRMTADVSSLLSDAAVELPVAGVFPLQQYKDALTMATTPGLNGKVLFEMQHL